MPSLQTKALVVTPISGDNFRIIPPNCMVMVVCPPLGHVFGTWLWCEQPETILTHLIFRQVSEYFEKARKLEGRVASDQDLKTSDLLRYYVRDTDAAKNLLYRRARCLADYENANKALDKARVKGKEIAAVSNHEIIRCK